ncbi:hypothetical protein GIJ63_18675 [Enterobacter bugandensis]|uniref:DUF6388 family protein n=1 Tax=Enterobacter bugandensis TaxID=881260 RepID=UPI001299C099|nr:DUF6388 family protein [Enterobacter bugandensis]MRE95408.1 hypothetical protein [Enterobacter bugandensis]
MKTRKQCFEAARQQFISSNPTFFESTQNDAKRIAHSLGITEDNFINEKVNRAFRKYLDTLPADSTARIIEMMAPDESTRKALLLEYYQEISSVLGIPFETYLREIASLCKLPFKMFKARGCFRRRRVFRCLTTFPAGQGNEHHKLAQHYYLRLTGCPFRGGISRFQTFIMPVKPLRA